MRRRQWEKYKRMGSEPTVKVPSALFLYLIPLRAHRLKTIFYIERVNQDDGR
jgi:hypothetical protein